MANIVSGKKIRIKLGGDLITFEEQFDYEFSKEVIEASNKDGDYKLGGSINETVNVTAHFTESVDATNTFFTARAAAKADTILAVIIGGTEVGDTTLEGDCVISNVSWSNSTGDTPSTWTATLNISGDFAEGTVS